MGPVPHRRAVWTMLAMAAAATLFAVTPSRADTLLLDRFRDYIESLRVQGGIPGLSAAIIGNNGIVWSHAFGQQDVEHSVATRTDTPFHVDGLTEIVSSTLLLQCVEQGRLSLDDHISQFRATSPDANLTVRQVLTHTTGTAENPVYAYRPDRIEALARAIRVCTSDSYRETLANMLEQLAMVDSVPGPDSVHPEQLTEGIPTAAQVTRYTGVLARLATPYSVDSKNHPTPSSYPATTLGMTSGLISTVFDYAQYDLGLKSGLLIRGDTLTAALQPPVNQKGQRLPHGIGWFVQSYNNETVAWNFGMGDNASSSLVIMAPARGLTLVALANSNGLVKPFPLGTGDVTVSPFARVFLELFLR